MAHRSRGELLHYEREPQEVLDSMKQQMGSMAFAAQYLQSPVPLGVNLIRWEWFRRWTQLPDRKVYGGQIVQSWDTASKTSELNDHDLSP
ncbi:hypothetical protein [Pseudorhodoplanes sp.]|uniref:hypothetical protein n=1 Tax=Pseudorhodoplanes sp. TaxID=1934341 RepID=UPI003D0E8F2D